MFRAADNLRCYIQRAHLPPMVPDPNAPEPPPEGHKSHMNVLHVRPESWRRLENIFPLEEDPLFSLVRHWIDDHIPDESLGVEDVDYLNGERFTISCPPSFNVAPHFERRPLDIRQVSMWLDNIPLMTAQRTIHLVFPETRLWAFFIGNVTDQDRGLFQYFHWSRKPVKGDTKSPDEGVPSLIVAFQPPWVLSPADMKDISQCTSHPPFRLAGHAYPPEFSAKDRFWAKLWDTCVTRKTRWFVITSYDEWIFGVFSAGWTIAFTSPILLHRANNPTILEMLTYWIASSMSLPDACIPPTVGVEHDDGSCNALATLYDVMGQDPLASAAVAEPVFEEEPKVSVPTFVPQPEESESNWDGKSADAETSAGVSSHLSQIVSISGLDSGFVAPFERPSSPRHIQAWIQRAAWGAHPEELEKNLSPVVHSAPRTYEGTWLM